MSVVLEGLIEDVTGLPTEYCGAKVEAGVIGSVCGKGTISGLAASDAKLVLCAPTRMIAVCSCGLLRSIAKPWLVKPVNGVAVPDGHVTRMLAGVHTWLPTPHI